MNAWLLRPFASACAVAFSLMAASCSLLEADPLCAHPSCLAHLHLGASESEVISGTWSDAAWRRGVFKSPVGRDLVILRCYSSVSPLAFEDDELLGWVHRFEADAWQQGGSLRMLEGLHSGVSLAAVRKVLGTPDRVVRFHSEVGEEFEIWSWEHAEVALCCARFLDFDPLKGIEKLGEEATLLGYVEGFKDFRSDRG